MADRKEIAGALRDWTWHVALLIVVGFAVDALINSSPIRRDDSDPGQWGVRSGMSVRTDCLTGLQYLATTSGLTPRLSTDGKQIRRACK